MNVDVQYDYLTAAEVGAIIRKTADYVARQCNAGHLRGTKLGNEWRIHRAEVERFMGLDKAPVTRPGRRRIK